MNAKKMHTQTPAPWRFEKVAVCEASGKDFGEIIAANGVSVAESVYEDDATKIVAVHDLLAALEELTRCMVWHGEQGHFVAMDAKALDDARAAISRLGDDDED